MKKKNSYQMILKTYIAFLKKNNLYDSKKKFFFENNIEKFKNWSKVDFKKSIKWYLHIKKK